MAFQTKKSLGQHFLRGSAHLNAIADAAEVAAGDVVLEIGPGEGALTEELLERGARVIAIEKDHRLIPILQEKFAGRNFEVYEADALEFEVPKDCRTGEWKVIGNIPYYITGALLRRFLSNNNQPSLLVFLIQKEVAERIARSKKESILSLSIKAYGTPRYVKTVPAGAFVPPPKVDSAILAVTHISRTNFKNVEQEELFFKLLHAGFGSKRKLLASNLKPILGDKVTTLFEKAGIPPKTRAEDVPLEQWLLLTSARD